MPSAIRVRRQVLDSLLEEARRDLRVECCGFLAGCGEEVTAIYPAVNALASPTAYEIAPRELFRLVRAMRSDGLEHLGIYHSHPAGPNLPSPRDLRRAYYPGVAYFIVSPAGLRRPVRAFRIREARFLELAILPV